MTKLTLLEFLTYDAVFAELEQSSHAIEIKDRGTAVGRTPAGVNESSQASVCIGQHHGGSASSNREDPYTNQSHKEFDGDISKLMGALA